MRNRRYRCNPNNLVFHVTNRTVSGLSFVAKTFMSKLIAGIMAKSQERNPVQISHFVWMSNHYHMILAGRAKHISDFIRQMQSEVAKMVKRLTPQYEGKVWESQFHEQRLCTPEDVLEKINYIYSNPVKAGLVPHISEWTGLNSFNMYKSGSLSLDARWTPSQYLVALVLGQPLFKCLNLLDVPEVSTRSEQPTASFPVNLLFLIPAILLAC